MSYLSFLTGLGRLNGAWRNARAQLQSFIDQSPALLTAMYVPNGTPTGDFADQWLPYACPDVAIVLEGTTLWITYDGGSNWINPVSPNTIPTGTIDWSFDSTLKSGYLWLDGAAHAISSYSALNTYLNTNIPAAQRRRDLVMSSWTSSSQATFTISNGITGLADGDIINLYWNSGGNSRLSMSVSGSSSSSMTVSGGSGDAIPNSVGMAAAFNFASTKFIVPDARGRVLAAVDNLGSLSANRMVNSLADLLGGGYGTETHTLTISEMPSHSHTGDANTTGSTGVSGNIFMRGLNGGATITTNSTGSGNAHNNTQPTLFISLMIKT